MKPDAAIAILSKLKKEADSGWINFQAVGKLAAWRSKVMLVLDKANCQQISAFSAIPYTQLTGVISPMSKMSALRDGLLEASGLLEAAIFELTLMAEEEEVVFEGHAFDSELWQFVEGLVEGNHWDKVASATVTFVEDRIRGWAGSPKTDTGGNLVGKALFTKILDKNSQYRLGNEAGEWEGWLYLGMGFAQALGNYDRHNVKKREDIKLYALGVLGLGSLLLTQLRYQHSDIFQSS